MRNVGSPFSRSQALGRFKVRAAPTGIDVLCAFCSRPPCFWDSPSAVTDLQALLASSKAEVLAARDKATHSAMNIAAYHLNVEGVKALIAAGADVSNPDKKRTPTAAPQGALKTGDPYVALRPYKTSERCRDQGARAEVQWLPLEGHFS